MKRNSRIARSPEFMEEPYYSRIRLLSVKLRCMAHLLGSQSVEDQPMGMEEIYMGCGILLDEIAFAMRQVSTEMEGDEIQRARKESGKKV